MNDAKDALTEEIREFGADAVRDVWLFNQETHEVLYIRDDVEEKISDVDVSKFIENERYGYVTGATYDLLFYADYEYTVRGFSEFEQFRAFLTDTEGEKVGVLASLDQSDDSYNFDDLYRLIVRVISAYPAGDFTPA